MSSHRYSHIQKALLKHQHLLVGLAPVLFTVISVALFPMVLGGF